MKNMGSVFMDEDAGLVIMIVGIASNMRAPVHQQNLFAGTSSQSLCQDTPGVARAYY
jgi:hypothetical protein